MTRLRPSSRIATLMGTPISIAFWSAASAAWRACSYVMVGTFDPPFGSLTCDSNFYRRVCQCTSRSGWEDAGPSGDVRIAVLSPLRDQKLPCAMGDLVL